MSKKTSFEDLELIINQKLSEEQREAAKSLQSTVISAGAGSGKTTVLSYRFMNLLLHGAHANEILTLTFTRKAASEMYERIYLFLSSLSKRDEYFKTELEKYFARSVISTLDSFWLEIARTDSFYYGLARDFKVLDNSELKAMVNKVFESLEFIDLTDEERESLELISSSFLPSEVKEFFLTVAYNTTLLTEQTIEFQNKAFSAFFNALKKPEKIKEILKSEFFDKVDEIAEYAQMGSKDPYHNGNYLLNKEKLENNDLLALEDIKLTPPFFKNEENDRFKELVTSIYRPYLDEIKQNYVLSLVKEKQLEEKYNAIIPRFIQELNKEKRKNKALTYKDIEDICKDTLIRNKNIRSYYKKRFSYIMVDEFQDNNQSQLDILYLLAEREDLFSSSIPKAEDLDKKKLFFVGDSKQSIYRFRGADVSVFNSLEKEVVEKMDGLNLTLSTNYRSTKALVNHFNEIFKPILVELENKPKEVEFVNKFQGTKNESFSALHSEIGVAEGKDFPTTIETIAIEVNELEDDEDLMDVEARVIADKILKITDKENGLKIYSQSYISDDEGSRFVIKERSATFNDIAVLFPKMSGQRALERAFRDKNIPYRVIESNAASSDGIAYDLYSFLNLEVFPNDKLSFLTLLNSPFVRLSDQGQKEFLNKEDEEFIAFSKDVRFKSNEDQVSYDKFKNLYLDIKAKIGRVKLTEILEKLYYLSGYHSYVVSSNRTGGYENHFEYLWTLASNFDRDGKNIVEFLDELRPFVGKTEKINDIKTLPLGESGVELMTVHKSKGLGFPIVFLANTNSSGGNSRGKIQPVITKYNNKDLVFMDVSKLIEEGNKDYISSIFEKAENARLNEEVKRALYVALTRAKNHFFFVTSNKKRENTNTFRSHYLPLIKGGKINNISLTNYSDDELKLLKQNVKFFNRDKNFYNGELAPKGIFEVIKFPVKEEVETKSESRSLPSFETVDFLNQEKQSYSYFGTLVHLALEAKLNNVEPQYESSNGSLSQKEEEILKEKASEIATSFLTSDFYIKNIKGKKIETEVRFYIPKDNIILEGSADLFLEGDEFNLVVDYKTDHYYAPDIHKKQVVEYVKALETLYGKKCYGTVLYVRDFSTGPIWDRKGDIIENLKLS